MPRLYVQREGNTSLTGRSTGVREHGMLSKQVEEPRRIREVVSGYTNRKQSATQEGNLKMTLLTISEFRWFHSSKEVG